MPHYELSTSSLERLAAVHTPRSVRTQDGPRSRLRPPIRGQPPCEPLDQLTRKLPFMKLACGSQT